MAKQTTSKTKSKVRSGGRKTGQVDTSKVGSQNASKSPTTSSTSSVQATMLTHEQIAERAKKIWQDRGCAPGSDEQNWYEAEMQLKEELRVH